MSKPIGVQRASSAEVAPSARQPVGSVVLDWVRLSTRAAPKRDQFEVFRENFSQHLYGAEIENRAEGAFEGDIEILRAGNVGVSRIVAGSSTYARTRRHVSDSDDALTLFVGISEGPAIEQAGTSHKLHPGSGFLYHGAIPAAGEASAPTNLFWGIKVANARISSSLARGGALKPTSVPAELPAMQLITQYLNSYATVAASPDPNVREAFGTHLVDLVMLIVGADRNSLELIKGRGLKAARTEAILGAIARHFTAPNLTAEKIGINLGITGRQVHRLLEETTKTFCEHLLERRLIEAHKLLTDPACSRLNVAEIARRAGFSDRTYFHRVFRIRFGGTPMDVRAAAARENARRFCTALPKV